MKSIRSFLIAVIGCLVVGVCLLAIFIAYGFARYTAIDIIYSDLESLANSVSRYIAADVEKEMAVLQSLAVSDVITSTELTLEEKAAYTVSYLAP